QLFAAEQRPGAAWPVVSQMPLSHEALPVEPGAVALHALPLTILQLPSQVAPAMPLVAPSSQPSPASRTPLPQAFVAAQTPGAPPVVLHRPLSHEALPVEPGAVALHALPLTILQLASQLAPGMPLVMPSSQPSPASRTPLPQLLVATHTPGAPPIVLHRPLSHEALPVAPGAVALHASPVTILQLASQASPAPPLLPPWSQPSPASRTPLPQTFAAEHTPGAAWPVVSQMPLSHEPLPVEPGAVALHALPVTILQLASQASPAPPLLPPSSQPSPASRTPLPHTFAAEHTPGAAWPVVSQMPLSQELLPVEPGAVALHALPLTILQAASHASPGLPLLPPWSQPSPASRTPLPQLLVGEQTPGAGTPVVSQMPLSHEALPVEPGAVALQALPSRILQVASHVSPGFPLLPPWSHPSPASSTPLPQALAGAQTPGAGTPVVSQIPLAHDELPVEPGAVALQALPSRILQVALHASPGLPLLPPWSQPSPASRTPLPQLLAGAQTPGAGTPVVSQMPLSHEALPVDPGAVALQALPLTILQAASHASPGLPLLPPWSQPSPASRTPLPQLLVGEQTPGAGTPVVSQMPLSHEALPVEPGAVALQALPSRILQV